MGKVKEFEIALPSSLGDIKLWQWQKYIDIYSKAKDEAGDEEIDQEFLSFKLLEIFCGVDLKEISKLPVGLYSDAIDHINGLFSGNYDLIRRFKMVGTDGVEVEFGVIPNLSKMSMGEYMDLDKYYENIEDKHKAMAVLYRPIHESFRNKESYRVMEYGGTERFADIMKEMPLDIVFGVDVFFYRLGMKLSTHLMDYSLKQLTEMDLTEEQKGLLEKNTDGINRYMRWLKEMSESSMTLPGYQLPNV